MRTKHFILILCCVLLTTTIIVILGPAEPNDSLKSIVTHTHRQFNKLQENLRVGEQKHLEIDLKYLSILGFTGDGSSVAGVVDISGVPTAARISTQYYKYNVADDFNDVARKNQKKHQAFEIKIREMQPMQQPHTKTTLFGRSGGRSTATTPYNATKNNFSIVTYVLDGQGAAAILLAQNIANKLPNENLLIYDLGMAEDELRVLNAYCNNTKCTVIAYDLSVFPSYISDQRMHAYRPIVIRDALMRCKCILYIENNMRIRGGNIISDLSTLQQQVLLSGVLGWATPTAVSTRTHPKMFNYFQTKAEEFIFLRMIDLDTILFSDSHFVTDKVMLPWIKCALTVECIDPIGAQSYGCKYNKKPQYRYSGCHDYDTSAFNIVLGLTWHWDETKYAVQSDKDLLFFKETLDQATKILENRRRNTSETSEHPFTEE